MDGGIASIKRVIETTFESQQYEIYFYCLGALAPLIFHSDLLSGAKNQNEWIKPYDEICDDFKKEGIVPLLLDHLKKMYDRKSSQLKFLAPLLLALKSLAQSSKDLKAQLLGDQDGLLTIFLIVS